MPLEDIEGPGKYLDSLNPNWPVGGTDDIAEGDNHIRGTKNTMVNSFPAVAGPVNATHQELSYMSGVTSSVQSQLNNKSNEGHNHDSRYALTGHSHSQYAPAGHSHSQYALTDHVHPQYDAYEPRIAALEASSGGGEPYVPVQSIYWANLLAVGLYEFNKTSAPNKMYAVTILNSAANTVVTVQLTGPGYNQTFTAGYTNAQGHFNGVSRAIDQLNYPNGSYTATYRVGGVVVGSINISIIS